MGAFNTQKTLNGDPSFIPTIAARIESDFSAEGFEVQNQSLLSGAAEISITKGGTFKAVLGMRTALKVMIKPQGGQILFDAGVGIIGQQAIPTIISVLIYWPVLLTQIWGLIKQSQLDDKALSIAEEVISQSGAAKQEAYHNTKYCQGCGTELPHDAIFCPKCGRKQ